MFADALGCCARLYVSVQTLAAGSGGNLSVRGPGWAPRRTGELLTAAPLEGTWTGTWTGCRGGHGEVPEGDGTVALPKLGQTVLCQPPE